MFVSGIDFYTLTCGYFYNCQPYCDKQFSFVAFHQLIIDIPEGLTGSLAILHTVPDQDLGDHHKERRRNTLTGDIRHNKSNMIVIHQEEIIEITADLFGRCHGCINIKLFALRESREQMRKLTGLDCICHPQFQLDPLFFCRDFLNLVHIMIRP